MIDILNITLHVLNLIVSTVVPPLSSFIQKISSSKCLGCDLQREKTQESLILNEVTDIKALLMSYQSMMDRKIDHLLGRSINDIALTEITS